MPGIVGIIGNSPEKNRSSEIAAMVASMSHFPYYNTGSLSINGFDVHLGWISMKGSYSDCMPVWNKSRDVGLIFSGEHLGERSESTQLRPNGHGVNEGNATALLRWYEDEGIDFLKTLNGWFCGVVIDLRSRSFIVFNDRFGLGRLYFHESDGVTYFASEAKALLRILPKLRGWDADSLAELFGFGCAMQNRTLFGGISLVPGGSAWIFQNSEVRKTSYFLRNEWERQPELGEEEFYGKLDETLTRILPRYFGGGQRVGMSLTGGLDSRMILACYPPIPSALPCYTFAGMIREAEDVRLSRRIASFCSQSYEVISLNQEFFRNFPKLAAQSVYLTDGALDVTGSSGLYTNGIAREIAPVRLTGHYGGEVLRRNIVLRPDRVDRQMISIDLASHLDHQISAYRKNIDPSSTSFVVFKQVPWHHFARLAMEQTQLTVRSPYLDNEIVALAFQAPNSEAVNKRIACRLVVTKNNALSEIPTDFGLLGKPGVRSELRRKYQGFIHRAEYAYDYGMPNWMAKIDNALSFLRPERLFLGRHKYCHFRIWYKTELSQCVRDILLDPSTLSRSYLNAARVQQIVETHLSGQQNHTLAIHKLLTSQLIERHLLKAT